MAEELNHYLIPVREKRKILEKNPEQVWEILKKGQRKAQSVAQQTMENVRKLVGLEL
jgi:tryptophanyl-tRNA synthetase